jgi:hypothetical protein
VLHSSAIICVRLCCVYVLLYCSIVLAKFDGWKKNIGAQIIIQDFQRDYIQVLLLR